MDDLAKDVQIDDLKPDCQLLAREIGVEAVVKMGKILGGTQLYIPKFDEMVKAARIRRVIEEFTGYNYKELALKYNLSEMWVRQIIQKDQLDSEQMKLFDQVANN